MAFRVPSGSLPTLKKLKPFACLEISIYVALQTETGPLFVGVEWKFGEWRANSFVLVIGQHSKSRVKQIQKAGYSVLFKDNKAIVKGKNKTFVLCELNSKGQYFSDFIPTVSNIYVAETEEAELWHRRLGHLGNHA
ncbi:hypothetical protein AVEN_211600-1, partial [Araneus ventricosus]